MRREAEEAALKAGDDTAQGFDAWNAALWEESADFFYKRAHDADMIDITLRNAKQIRPRKEQAKDAVASAMWAVSLALEVIDKPKKYSSVDPAEWAKKALDGRKLKMHADAGENVDCLFAYGYLLSCAMVPNHDNFFERDEGTAFTWFLAAAKRGHCAACYRSATCISSARGRQGHGGRARVVEARRARRQRDRAHLALDALPQRRRAPPAADRRDRRRSQGAHRQARRQERAAVGRHVLRGGRRP